jgi:signal transduction histidine kinase
MRNKIADAIAILASSFLPARDAVESERYFKLGFQVTTLLTTTIISLCYIFICLYVEFFTGVAVCIFFVIFHYYLLTSIKKQSLNDYQVAHFFGIMTLLGLGTASWTSGGPSSPVNFWFISTIVVSFWFADKKTSILWFIICIVYLGLLSSLYIYGYEYPLLLNNDRFTLFKIMMTVGILGYLSVVFLTINQWRDITIQELKQINKTKDRMLAMIGHDLKNPLSVIEMQVKRIKHQSIEEERKTQAIERSAKKMNQIIDNMMIYDQIKSKNYQSNISRINLNEIIDNLLEDFQTQANSRNINISVERPVENISLIIDSLALERILTNLLSNALKYTPSGKNIFIKWNGDGELIILDEGEGFDQMQKESYFSLYSKTKNKLIHNEDQSFGIGLYIVKSLCLEINLELILESAGRNLGSCFTLNLTNFIDSSSNIGITQSS